jgi:D-galactarolactone cycloisomerase
MLAQIASGRTITCRGQLASRSTAVEIHCLRYRLAQPMLTVFGPVDARPALVLRVEDDEGASGWGDIWCNFPQPGAEYRARLAALVVPGALTGLDVSGPQSAFATLRQHLHRLALQAGEPGPADQIAAGLDIALHDLAARRKGVPLAAYLGGAPRPLVPYASGIDSRLAGEMMTAARTAGYRRFKLRIGFGRESDVKAVATAQSILRDRELLMVDANQSWDLDEALAMVRAL